MSLIAAALLGAGSALLGRWIFKRHRAAATDPANARPIEEKKQDADEAKAAAEVEAEVPTKKDDSEPAIDDSKRSKSAKKVGRSKSAQTKDTADHALDGFVCQLGDVLTRETGEEAWLAGGVVLSEEIPVAVLFVAPEAGQDCAIYVRPHPRTSLFWLEPLDPSAVLVGGEPPSAVEHRGVRFDRARRLPLRPRRIGVGAPDVGDGVMLAEYASAGAERLLVLKSNNGSVRAYRGLELEAGTYEVIASGDTTL